jgi:IclR family KDG regulon transcriptional repressor
MKSSPVAAVVNAFHIVEILSDDNGQGVGEIARILNISKTTTHRLLQSLIEVSLVRQDPDTQKYRLTYRLFELGAKAFGNSSLVQAANGPMTKLNDLTEETIHLGVLDSQSMVYLHKLDAKHTIVLASRVGKVAPLHCTALGKVLLAWRDRATINEIVHDLEYTVRTPRTIRSPEEFVEHLKKVKQDGYALDQEENEEGITCFAVPIFDYNEDTVAGLSISSPNFRLKSEQIPDLIESLKKCGLEISISLGYRK